MCAFLSLAISLAPLSAILIHEEYIPARVTLLSPDGPVRLGSPVDHSRFLLPLTSLSEMVVRAEPLAVRGGASEIGVEMVHGGSPTLTTLVHGKGEFVVLDARRGGEPLVVAEASPPAKLGYDGAGDLAFVVRRDGQCLLGGMASIVPAGPHESAAEGGVTHLLIFGLPAEGHVSQASGFRGWEIVVGGVAARLEASAQRPAVFALEDLEREGDGSITLELGEARVDAIAFVRESAALAERPVPLVAIAQRNISADAAFDAHSFGRRPVVSAEDAEATPKPWECARSYWFEVGGMPELDEPDRALTLVLGTGSETAVARARERDESGLGRTSRELLSRLGSVAPFRPIEYADAEIELLSKQQRAGVLSVLQDVSEAAGIRLVHLEGDAEQLDIRPTMGPGAAWGDVNDDGHLDLVVLQGAGRPECDALADRVWLGSESGVFRDASATAGLGRGDAGMGALLVDLDGDGDLDLYCANYGLDRLYLNRGNGTFEEATALLPGHDLWSAGVAAADADGDGDLDLYVTSYLDYDLEKMPPAEELGRYQREDPVEMLPFAFPGQRNVYLKNQLAETGALGFVDVTEELGLLDVQGRGMQPVFWDFDRDGDEDLYVANDVSFNVLYRNEGDGTFKDVSFSTGLDDPRGGMGLAVGDVDGDGDEDLFLTNWQLEANALYLNGVVSRQGRKRRRASFHDGTVRSGLGPSGIGVTSWGAELFDLDLDGDLDLYVANGYTSPDYESTGICVGQNDQLFLGDGSGRFESASWSAPNATAPTYASRGAIGADYDRDGDVDLLVTANNGPVRLLRNEAQRAGRWVGVRLRQDGHNGFGIGAEVTVRTKEGREHRSSLRAGQGYLTGNAPELHFGLGATEGIEAISVRWPGGETTTHTTPLDAWATLERAPR